MKQKILIIGLVWPEPTSSAAGWRILQLVDFFISQDYEVHFACAAQKSEASYDLVLKGVVEHEIRLNHYSFNSFIGNLMPHIVMFDRFMIEEQYGWRVREVCSDAITILDTEDLHFVRKAREISYKKKTKVDYYTDEAKREIASVLRCDLSLIISKVEIDLMIKEFKIASTSLFYLPFLEDEMTPESITRWKTYKQRNHLMFIGNFWHEPNYQTVRYLKEQIWPLLKEKLPKAELHIYGSYPSQKVLEMHQPKERFFIKGKALDVFNTMVNYRVLLAPIVFGAGLKGKFVDAMRAGLPAISSTIGTEGIFFKESWNGFIANDIDKIIDLTTRLYLEEDLWYDKQRFGELLLKDNFDKTAFYKSFRDHLHVIQKDLIKWRKQHFIGQVVQQQQFLASKYLSKWIEEKNK